MTGTLSQDQSAAESKRMPAKVCLDQHEAQTLHGPPQVLSEIGAAIQNSTGVAVQCASFPPAWQDSSNLMDDEIFCGWSDSKCLFRGGRQVFIDQTGHSDTQTAR